jgi:hypothetical protein
MIRLLRLPGAANAALVGLTRSSIFQKFKADFKFKKLNKE